MSGPPTLLDAGALRLFLTRGQSEVEALITAGQAAVCAASLVCLAEDLPVQARARLETLSALLDVRPFGVAEARVAARLPLTGDLEWGLVCSTAQLHGLPVLSAGHWPAPDEARFEVRRLSLAGD